MLACTKPNLEMVNLLLDAGADSDTALKNKDGWNCFHIAVRYLRFVCFIGVLCRFLPYFSYITGTVYSSRLGNVPCPKGTTSWPSCSDLG